MLKSSKGLNLKAIVKHYSSTANLEPAGRWSVADGTVPASPTAVKPSAVIAFGGDTSLGDAYIKRVNSKELSHRLQSNPESFFSKIAPLLQADKCILNLETVLHASPKGGPADKPYRGWDDPSRTLPALKSLGVDAVSLANNHTVDFDYDNLFATMDELDRSGISRFGAGRTLEEAQAPLKLSLTVDDEPLDVLVFGFQKYAAVLDRYGFYASSATPGVSPLVDRRAAAVLSEARRANPDALIIAFPHWGQNYKWASQKMQERGQLLLDSGANIVIGHGAHMLQQVGSHKNKPLIYSSGNCVFNSVGRYTIEGSIPYSFICRLEIGRHQGRIHIQPKLYPIISDNQETNWLPAPASDDQMDQVIAALNARNSELGYKPVERQRDSLGWYVQLSA